MEAATAPKPKQAKGVKNPQYRVYRQTPSGDFAAVTQEPVRASNRKAAIVSATKSVEDKEGTFLVIPAEQVKLITRAFKTERVDQFT